MRIFVIIIGILLVVGTGVYAWLGGFEKPVVYKTPLPACLLAGKFYQGKASDDALGRVFYDIKILHDKQELPGILAAVYYKTDTKVRDTARVFLGVLLKDSLATLPAGCEYHLFPKTPGIRARVVCSPYVMPRPETVQIRIKEFAEKEGLQMQQYAMEKYLNERTFEMDVPVK